jgi:UDP-glucose 4-epimerase
MKATELKNTKILITGGAGFIGSTLAETLVSKGADVTIVDAMIAPYGANPYNLASIKKKITFVKGDVRSKRLMRKLVKDKQYVFHLAGQTGRVISMDNPWFDTDINIDGTLTVLDAMKKTKSKGKIIFASSRGVIGEPLYLPVDEKHPLRPKDVYGANKLVAEHYCFLYAQEYGLQATVLRFNNIYGPKCQIRSNHYGTINLFTAYALTGKPMTVYGSGGQTRDYVYVTDVVSALIAAMATKANQETFFVASNTEVSLLEIVNIIKKHVKKAKHVMLPYPDYFGKLDFDRFICSYDKIHKKLGWSPKVSIEEGIKRTIMYYKKNLKYYL